MTTQMTKRVKSISNKGGEEKIYSSIGEAANDMIRMDEYKDYNISSIRANISAICGQRGTRKFACDRRWVYVDDKTDFKFEPDEWKQYEQTPIYFSKKYNFAYNINKKRKVYGTKSGDGIDIKIYIDGKDNDYSIRFIKALWVTFNGPIKDTQYIYYKNEDNKENYYENINCFDYKCLMCEKLYEGDRYNSKYCSTICKSKHASILDTRKNLESRDLYAYLSAKIKKYKKPPYNLTTEECVEICEDKTCEYCGKTNLLLRQNDCHHPDILTIDAIEPEFGHYSWNLVCSCLFCNRMKHAIPLLDWIKLLEFLRGTKKTLDISDKEYTKIDDYISKKYHKMAWGTLRLENPELYPSNEEAKEAFNYLKASQNNVDAIYKIFPITMFTASYMLNASCDRIIAGDSTNHQIIPLFMQWAKNNLSPAEFLRHMTERNYLTWDLSKAIIILPKNYYKDSLFIQKLVDDKKRFGKGHIGMKRSTETKINISNARLGKNQGATHFRSKKIKAIDKDGKETIYDSSGCAQRKLELPKLSVSNILACANGKHITAYGYKWEFV